MSNVLPMPSAFAIDEVGSIERFLDMAWQHLPIESKQLLQPSHDLARTIVARVRQRSTGTWRTLSITELNLSVRSTNALKDEGRWQTAQDLNNASDLDLLRIPNFGRKCLKELRVAITDAINRQTG